MRPMLALAGLLACLAQGVNAKSLTWSFSSDVQTFDPHTSRVSFTNAFLANIYETLVRMDDKLAIEPRFGDGLGTAKPDSLAFPLAARRALPQRRPVHPPTTCCLPGPGSTRPAPTAARSRP